MSERHVLAWDLGTSGAKAGIVSASGEVLASEFEPTALYLDNGGAEQRPGEWWEALCRATLRLLGRELVPRASIAAFGVTAQWSGTVAVDAAGEALGNAIIWMDSRGAEQVERLCGGFPEVQGYALHKLWRWMRLTGGAPGHAGKDPLAHILWLRENRPATYERAKKFLEPKDYLTYRLSGRLAASYDSIALHWVTDNRNPERITYDEGLLALAGIARDKLPELVPATETLGSLRPELAERFGLGANVAITASAPDVHSAAIGAGTTRDHRTHLYVGTSSWISCHVPQKKTDVLHNMAALPAGIPGRYLLLNEQESAGACLTHLRDKLFFPSDALSAAPAPQDFFPAFDRVASASPPGAKNLLFLPWLYGERTPVEDRNLRGAFFNYSLEHERSDIARATLEGIAYNSRWLFGHVERFVGERVEALRFIGGGADSTLWCQILADILDRPLLKVKAPRLSNLRGAAFIAFVGIGELDFDEIENRVAVETEFEPRREHRGRYEQLFGTYLELYRKNRSIFQRLNRKDSPSPR
jgi:xylulokinase